MTMPKQWYRGTGVHTLSSGVSRIASPTKRPLLRMLRWLSVAPLGAPVVPLVNWMLIASSGRSCAASDARRSIAAVVAAAARPANGRQPAWYSSPSVTTSRRWGSASDASSPGAEARSSGARSVSMAT